MAATVFLVDIMILHYAIIGLWGIRVTQSKVYIMKALREDERLPCPKSFEESHIPSPTASNAYSFRTSVSGLPQIALKSCLCDAEKAQFQPAIVCFSLGGRNRHFESKRVVNHLNG